MTRSVLLGAALAASAALCGCSNAVEAPTDPGICWHMVQLKDGKYHFNVLARNQPNLENCAARLEGMRLDFNRLGAHQEEEIGAYQGQFIFIEPAGVFTARNLESTRYPALVRTQDGRLAIPGAIRQQ
jgi:hypothetical protein